MRHLIPVTAFLILAPTWASSLAYVLFGWFCAWLYFRWLGQLDTGEARRRVSIPDFDENASSFKKSGGYSSKYIQAPRGGKSGHIVLFTQQWLPAGEPKACIFMLHGFADSAQWFVSDTAVRLAQEGYAVFAIDHEGHGRSDGLFAYVPSLDRLVRDAATHFQSVKAQYPGKPTFIWAESMGGAVGIKLAHHFPDLATGALFMAPMCKVSDKLRPPEIVVTILMKLARFFPQLAIVPTPDIKRKCFRDQKAYERACENPLPYGRLPRLGTAAEMLRVCEDLDKFYLAEVSIPYLLLHGAADEVTDPEVSKSLYDRSCSKDKTFKLYPGAWHDMLHGEPEETAKVVWADITTWLSDHTKISASSSGTTGVSTTASKPVSLSPPLDDRKLDDSGEWQNVEH